MELTLPTAILKVIFDFVDLNCLKNYDDAVIVCKSRWILFVDSLRLRKNLQVSKWTFERGIHNKQEICGVPNLKYVSEICESLIVNRNFNYIYDSMECEIINSRIKTLHIDFAREGKLLLDRIACESLETLRLVCIANINSEIFNNVFTLCPKLRRILIIESFVNEKSLSRFANDAKRRGVDLIIKNTKY